jgi:drug/metabolite transporter (DMT)-like permease
LPQVLTKEKKGIVFILISTTCFSVVNLLVKYLVGFPAHELVFFRSVISLFLTFIILKQKKLSVLGHNRKWLLVRGSAGIIALLMFFITLQRLPFANAVAIQYLSPLFTAILGVYILKEEVRPIQWLFFAIALSGIFIIKGFDTRVDWLMVALGVASALFAGIAYNAVRRLKDTEHPLQIVFYFPLLATPIMGIWCLFDFKMPEGRQWLLILLLGLFTQVAQYYMTMALHADKAARITPFKYFGAILAIVLGYTIFDEHLSYFNYLGMGLIMLGVLLNTFIKPSAVAKVESSEV